MPTRDELNRLMMSVPDEIDGEDDDLVITPDPLVAAANRNHVSAVKRAESLITRKSRQAAVAKQMGELYQMYGREGAESLLARAEAEGRPTPTVPKYGTSEWYDRRAEGLALKRKMRLEAERQAVEEGSGIRPGQQVEIDGRTLTYRGPREQRDLGNIDSPTPGLSRMKDVWVWDDTGVEMDQRTLQNKLRKARGEEVGRSLRDIKAERLATEFRSRPPEIRVGKKREETKLMEVGPSGSGLYFDQVSGETLNFRPQLEAVGAIRQPRETIEPHGGTLFTKKIDRDGNETIARSPIQPDKTEFRTIPVRNRDGSTTEQPVLADMRTGAMIPMNTGDMELARKEGKFSNMVVGDPGSGFLPIKVTEQGDFEVVRDANGRPVFTPEQARLIKQGRVTSQFKDVTILAKDEMNQIPEVKVSGLASAQYDKSGRATDVRIYYLPQEKARVATLVAKYGADAATHKQGIDADKKRLEEVTARISGEKIVDPKDPLILEAEKLSTKIDGTTDKMEKAMTIKSALDAWLQSAEGQQETPQDDVATSDSLTKAVGQLTDTELGENAKAVGEGRITDPERVAQIRSEILSRKSRRRGGM